MLTEEHEAMASVTHGIEWDVVKLPSQIMENWCGRRCVLHFRPCAVQGSLSLFSSCLGFVDGDYVNIVDWTAHGLNGQLSQWLRYTLPGV